jgi:catechol 2,3-dioxygenase-like lactoylglutathione lyase family enzyme
MTEPRLDHAGLSVRDLSRAVDWYCDAFGYTLELKLRVAPIDLDVVMLIHRAHGDRLELLRRNGSSPGLRAADRPERRCPRGTDTWPSTSAAAHAEVRADIDARADQFGTFDHVVRP